jgi:hypothetical protein
MVHISPDFETKKAFREAVKAGRKIRVYGPGIYPAKDNGREVVEAPARYHKWYATVLVRDGFVVKVVS